MNWKASPPAIEIAAASLAAAGLGSAVGFAVARLAPLGAGLAEAGGAGAVAAIAAWLVLGRVDRERGGGRTRRFVAVESLGDLLVAEDVLWLDQRVEFDDALLLDDPLPAATAAEDESRVVRLFAAQPVPGTAVVPFAGPADMVARIEDFLGQPRSGAAAEPARRADEAAAEDASAALHAALADIRRSLRQG